MPDPRIVEVRRLYTTADEMAREVGELRSEVQIPAINELRYAGFHVLEAIDDEGVVDVEVLGKAKNHCQRAMYEAAEAGTMFCVEEIKSFRHEYRDLVVSEVIADYHQKLARTQQAVDHIVKGRSERASVEEHVGVYMDEFRAVRDVVRIFDASRDDLNAKREQKIEGYRRFVIRSLLMLLGSIVAITIAILSR